MNYQRALKTAQAYPARACGEPLLAFYAQSIGRKQCFNPELIYEYLISIPQIKHHEEITKLATDPNYIFNVLL